MDEIKIKMEPKSEESKFELTEAYNEIEQGMEKGLVPKLTDEGTSGTYILRGVNKEPIGIFKPVDEE